VLILISKLEESDTESIADVFLESTQARTQDLDKLKPVCVLPYFLKRIRQKVFYGHRLTQINTDGNHKLLINSRRSTLLCDGKTSYEQKRKNPCKSVSEMCYYIILWVIIYVESYLTEHL
jgi:hypothetical protein